ncbi:MAG: hypothetical protein R8M45_00225 [Ghiorsea sp.]
MQKIDYTRPADAREHLYFIDRHETIGIDALSIRHWFWLFNAPSELTSFIQIISNAKEALLQMKAEDIESFDVPLADWIKFADYVIANKEDIVVDMGIHVDSELRKCQESHPLRGKGMIRHTLYTALWTKHQDTGQRKHYRQLQGHMILSHIHLMHDLIALDTYEKYEGKPAIFSQLKESKGINDSLSKACRFLRDLSFESEILDFEDLTAVKIKSGEFSGTSIVSLPTASFALYLTQKHKATVVQTQSNCVRVLGLFCQRSFVELTTKDRAVNKGYKRKKVSYRIHDGFIKLSPTIVQYDDDEGEANDPDGSWGFQSTLKELFTSEDETDQGMASAENDTGEEIYLVDYNEGDEVSYLSRLLAAQGRARQQVMMNQMMRNRWSMMTDYEVTSLLALLEKYVNKFERQQFFSEDAMMSVEVVTMMLLMLWTGSSIERARRCIFSSYVGQQRCKLAFDTTSNDIFIANQLLDFKTQPTQAQLSSSRIINPFVRLPDTANIGRLIRKLAAINDTQDDCYLFTHSAKKYAKSIHAFIQQLPHGHRVTTHKITQYLFYRVLEESAGDVMLASLVTCTPHALSQTQLHYSSPTANHIRETYIKAVGKHAWQDQPPVNVDNQASLNEQSYGSRLCPHQKNVALLVDKLSSTIKASPHNRFSPSLIQYHNTYTVYTSQMLAYATGFRAIKRPFILMEQLDQETGFAIISDKDGSDFYNSRLVWIPESVQAQLSNYAAHRQHIISDLNLRQDPDQDPLLFDAMFLLNKKGNLETLRPKHVAPMLEDFFPLPLNVNRRYLRTTLLEQDCPVEIINCFMGHWSRGEEPWSRYSSLCFADIAIQLKHYIPRILSDLGWKPVPSKVML